jgi:hypothetical protein
MKEDTKSFFNYSLRKDDVKESRSKLYSNKYFGTSIYPTIPFYKNITRLFAPLEQNEK